MVENNRGVINEVTAVRREIVSDIDVVNTTNTPMSQELIVEAVRRENNKCALELEVEKNRGLELELKSRESKNIELSQAIEFENAQAQRAAHERNLIEEQKEFDKALRLKAEREAEVKRRAQYEVKAKQKEELVKSLHDRVKTEITDLRDFAQRELMIKSLDCDTNNELGAFYVSQILDKNMIWAQYPLKASDGSSVTALSFLLGHYSSAKLADLIEPQAGNDVATITIKESFFIDIRTSLRGGETYKVYFTPEDIQHVIRRNVNFKKSFTNNLTDYLSEPSYFNESSLKTIETELRSHNYISKDTDFVRMVHDKIEDKQHTQLEDMVKESMSEFHCEMIKGKPTFLDTKGVVYTPSSLIQMFSGEEHQIVLKHPLTKEVRKFNPARPYIDEKMYAIYHSNIFYPAKYAGEEFNTFKGFKYSVEKLMYISPFIEFVNSVGCRGDKQTVKAFWSFFAKIVQGDVNKYSALAVISDEEELVNLLLKPFRQIMEGHYFRVSDKKQFTGINTVLSDKVLIEVDDEFLSHKGANIIFESLVKDINFSYQVKQGIYETRPNYSNCIVTSPNHNLVSKLAKKKMLIVTEAASDKANDYEYLEEIHKIIDDPRFASSLMYYLGNYKVQKDLLKRPTLKSFTNEEIEEGFPIELKWFYKCLQSGDFSSIVSEPRDNFGIRVSSDGLYKDFISYSKSISEPSTMAKSTLGTKISKILKPYGFIKAGQFSPNTGNAVDYSSLPECRMAFEKYTGLSNPNWTGDTWIANKS